MKSRPLSYFVDLQECKDLICGDKRVVNRSCCDHVQAVP